jgi:hypothetical protein
MSGLSKTAFTGTLSKKFTKHMKANEISCEKAEDDDEKGHQNKFDSFDHNLPFLGFCS